jgi:hypothetical protein
LKYSQTAVQKRMGTKTTSTIQTKLGIEVSISTMHLLRRTANVERATTHECYATPNTRADTTTSSSVYRSHSGKYATAPVK